MSNQLGGIWAADLLVVQTVGFRTLYVLFFVRHERRELVYFNVTASPTAAWIWHQLLEATPWSRRPRFLIHDRDAVYGGDFDSRLAGPVALSGLDLVVEGTARLVTDEPTLRRLAELYAAQGWPASVSDGAITAEYSAPSAGPAPWNLYVVTPSTAVGTATAEPFGATRWRFDPSIA